MTSNATKNFEILVPVKRPVCIIILSNKIVVKSVSS